MSIAQIGRARDSRDIIAPMHALSRCRLGMLPALITALLTGCGGSGSGIDPSGGGPSGVTVDKSGVWVGDTSLGAMTLIVDADGELLGFSHIDALAPDRSEYRTIAGSVGTQSEHIGQLRAYEHAPGLFNTEHYPLAGLPQLVDVRSNFAEQQTAELRLADDESGATLIYQAAVQPGEIADLAGAWAQSSIYETGNFWMDGDRIVIAQNRMLTALDIDADGRITGTDTETGWNWIRGTGAAPCLPPCGGRTDVWTLTGEISAGPLAAHNAYSVSLTRQLDTLPPRTLQGYLYRDLMLMILRDMDSDSIVYTYSLRADP